MVVGLGRADDSLGRADDSVTRSEEVTAAAGRGTDVEASCLTRPVRHNKSRKVLPGEREPGELHPGPEGLSGQATEQ